MKISNQCKIGTHFKKENVFLATVSESNTNTKRMLKSKADSKVPKDLIALFVEQGFISSEQYDVFYKDDTQGTPDLQKKDLRHLSVTIQTERVLCGILYQSGSIIQRNRSLSA